MTYSITDMLDKRQIPYVLVGDQIRCTCPDDIHMPRKGRPSTREDSFSICSRSGLWKCWTCGASGNGMSLVQELGFKTDLYWQLDLDLEPSQGSIDKTAPVDCDWLSYLDVPPLLVRRARGDLHYDICRELGIRWHPKSESWVLPFGDFDEETGKVNLVGYELKGPQGVRAHGPKGQYLFGDVYEEPIKMIVESPLDVAYILSHCYDLPVAPVASFGAQITHRQLALLGYYDVIVAMDNDEAGWEASERIMQADANGYSRVRFDYGDSWAKDPGDMPRDVLRRQVKDAIDRVNYLNKESA